MTKVRATRERFTFETPDHLIEAARTICVELDREYPYLANFHLNADGTYTLFSMDTVSRSISRDNGEEYFGRTGWDVDWIERDQQYCYNSSSGGGSLRKIVSGIYWRHPEMLHVVREETARYCDKAFRKRNKTRRVRRIPIDLKCPYTGHVFPDMMAWLESIGTESEVYYCSICKEHLPDRSEDLCDHVWWCDTDSTLRGPGSTEEYGPEPCTEEDCYHCQRALEAVH